MPRETPGGCGKRLGQAFTLTSPLHAPKKSQQRTIEVKQDAASRVLPRVTSVEPQVVVPSPKKSVSGAPFPIPNSNNTLTRIVDMVTCLRLCYVALLKGKNKVPI